MTEDFNSGPKAREALKAFDRTLNGPPCCPPEWEGDFKHLVEWATDFVIQQKKKKKKKKSAENSRVTGNVLLEDNEQQSCDQEPDDQQERDSETAAQPFRLSNPRRDRAPGWVVTYVLNAQKYPRLEAIVRSMRDVKVARMQDPIDEMAEFVDCVLVNHEGHHDVPPHEEELHVVHQKLSQVKTFLEDLRMDKACIASEGHQSQDMEHTVVCRGYISQYITNPERLKEMCIALEGSKEDEEETVFAELAEQLRELAMEYEGSEEEETEFAEFAGFAEWLWKQTWEEEKEKNGDYHTVVYALASDLEGQFREYLFLQEAHRMLSKERLKPPTASQNRQATILASESGHASGSRKNDKASNRNTHKTERNAGHKLPALRRWIDALGKRLRRS